MPHAEQNQNLPLAKLALVQERPHDPDSLAGNRPWREVEGFTESAVLDVKKNTLFITTHGVAHLAVTSVNAYPTLLAHNATMETALKRIRDRLRRAEKDQLVADVLALVDFGLADDGDEAADWREQQ